MEVPMPPPIPRLLPDIPFPPYTFVPGKHPHPFSDPRGHRFGADCGPPEPLDPERWHASRAYLLGIDLFNHGYYWEAHEAWERLWKGSGRTGPVATFLKGLIKLAAAGVKVREGVHAGVQSHARRARELFEEVASSLPEGTDGWLGLSLAELIAFADKIAAEPPVLASCKEWLFFRTLTAS